MTSAQTLYPQLLATLKGWHKADISPFQPWSNFRAVQAVNTQLSRMEGLRQAVKQFIEVGLTELSLTDSQAVQIIRWRFLEGEPLTLLEVMTRLGEPSIDAVNRSQRKAIEALGQTLLTKEKKSRRECQPPDA